MKLKAKHNYIPLVFSYKITSNENTKKKKTNKPHTHVCMDILVILSPPNSLMFLRKSKNAAGSSLACC